MADTATSNTATRTTATVAGVSQLTHRPFRRPLRCKKLRYYLSLRRPPLSAASHRRQWNQNADAILMILRYSLNFIEMNSRVREFEN
ncbi:hypothetical protein Nepgr_012299 [Nepenthes gracilis]|uniref:Uncharacterized protein n=1 Tax=Nepenthes gracilis TaxID=150966 RepID=A0AAD3SFR9_NEPGR|nr:hypothetical protein Nepgr_012299 [Nepenthes gracilis]